MKQLWLTILFFGLTALPAAAQEGAPLGTQEALQLALQNNPEIRAHLASADAAEGNKIQQSLRPNPQAMFEAENFAGDKSRDGFDAAEYTFGISQQIEIAGKRGKRGQVAGYEAESARQQASAGVQEVLARTKTALVRVAIAREAVALAEKRLAVAKTTNDTVIKRISAGKSADIHRTKTGLEVSAANIRKSRAQRELLSAQMELAQMIGMPGMNRQVSYDINVLPDAPSEAVVVQGLENAPASILSRLSVNRAEKAVELARANGVPDPTLGVGVRRFEEDDGSAFLASVSFPIPVSNRNQGAIREAQGHLRMAQASQEARSQALKREALELWRTLSISREEVAAYQSDLLPSARKAFTQAEGGFDRGAFTFLDFLDAQRTLSDVEENYLAALTAFYEAKARMDLLTGVYVPLAVSALDPNTQKKE